MAVVIEEHKSVADEYKAGKEAAANFLVGQGMKATKGLQTLAYYAKQSVSY